MLDTERLIAEVRARPQLYRKQHEDYNEQESKQQAWREVAAAVFDDWPNIPRAETYERILLLQKKWRSLRDAYNRELRIRAQGGPRVRRKYIYSKLLKFLNTDQQQQESSSGSEDPLRLSRLRAKRQRRSAGRRSRAKRLCIKNEVASPDNELEVEVSGVEFNDQAEYPERTDQGADAEPDSERLFLVSYAEEMRRLPAHVRMWARAQISKVMQEAVAYCCAAEHAAPAPASCPAPASSGLADVTGASEARQLHSLNIASDHAITKY